MNRTHHDDCRYSKRDLRTSIISNKHAAGCVRKKGADVEKSDDVCVPQKKTDIENARQHQ